MTTCHHTTLSWYTSGCSCSNLDWYATYAGSTTQGAYSQGAYSNQALWVNQLDQTGTVNQNQMAYLNAYQQYVTYNQYATATACAYGTINAHAETAEELAEREKKDAIRQAAAKRAEELLNSLLDDKQREQYGAHKHFDVDVAGKIYRLAPYDRVRLLEAGKATIAYCIHPDHMHGLPAADVLIAQKLLLETNEAHFLKTANASRVGQTNQMNVVNQMLTTDEIALEVAA